MKFQKLIKAEEWDGIEPFDKRQQQQNIVQPKIEKLLNAIKDHQFIWQKEEKILDILEDINLLADKLDDLTKKDLTPMKSLDKLFK